MKVTGGLMGLGVAYALTRLLVSSFIAVAPLAIVFPMTPDVRVLGATFLFCMFATIVSGLGPAMRLSRLDVFPQLKGQAGDGGAVSNARGRFWLMAPRNLLVVGQIGLSLALLATGGSFVRGALAAAESDPGFRLADGELPPTVDVLQVVGVAPGLRHSLFDPAPRPFFYEPIGDNFQSGLNLHVRIKSKVPALHHE